jgi:hypothetical protein
MLPVSIEISFVVYNLNAISKARMAPGARSLCDNETSFTLSALTFKS